MAATKKTRKEYFAEILSLTQIQENDELKKFIEKQIEQLEKRTSSKKPTATQLANEEFKKKILEFFNSQEERVAIISEMISEIPEFEGFSNQRVASLLTKLVNEGKLKKEIVKRKAYFMLPETEMKEEEEEEA